MSSTDRRHPAAPVAGLALVLALVLAGCSAAPKRPVQAVDNVNVVKSVRSQPAPAAATASDTAHVTTVAAAEPVVQGEAQQALNDYFAGVQLMKAGKFDDALLVFQQIAAQHPKLSGPHVNQALILYRQQKPDEAMEVLDRALKVNDRNPFAWNLRGMILRERGKFADARVAYERALAIDANYAKAHFNMGILSDLYLQDLRLALSHYERYQALQRKPDKAVGNWINDLRNRLGIAAPTAAPAPEGATATETPAEPPAPGEASPPVDAEPATPTPTTAG